MIPTLPLACCPTSMAKTLVEPLRRWNRMRLLPNTGNVVNSRCMEKVNDVAA